MAIPIPLDLAIMGAIRLYSAGGKIYEQIVVDAPAIFPDAQLVGLTEARLIVKDAFAVDYPHLVAPGAVYAEYWDQSENAPLDDAAVDALYRHLTEDINPPSPAETDKKQMAMGAITVAQWREGAGPDSPYKLIAITIVDIGMAYVGANPQAVGLSGNGGKLIAGVAARLSEIIPDDMDGFETKKIFGERLIAIVLRAGLDSFSENINEIVNETHLQEFIVEGLKPVIASMPDDLETQYKWKSTVEALSGPAFGAALGIMAKNPSAFFGRKFETGKAAGAIVEKVLTNAADNSLDEILSPSGVEEIVRSAITVVAENPALFIKGDGATREFKRDVLANVATTIKNAPYPFKGDLGASIAASAMEALKDNAVALMDVDDDWDEVVTAAVDMVIDGFKAGILNGDEKALEKILTREQIKEIGRVFLQQVATNPSMVVGKTGGAARTKELRNVVASVASAMAKDKELLLSGDDWMVIAGVAAEEVARNPGALVGLDEENPADAVLSGLLTTVLSTAGAGLSKAARQPGRVEFGATLREIMTMSIRAASINLESAAKQTTRDQVKALIEWIKKQNADNAKKLSSKEWLWLYKQLLPDVLEAGKFTTPTPSELENLLRGV